MSKLKLLCPCLFGLESILAGEIKRMGGDEVQVSDGKVTFWGDCSMVARANLNLRTAERVMIVLGQFTAQSFEELFQGVKALPLENFIGEKDRFPVKGWSINSKLTSVPDCQSIVKKAAVERLKEKYGISWFEETGELFQLQFSILKNEVTVMLDSSGVGLHKRGYRKTAMEAPIKETLAAGIVDLARIKPDSVLLDPFCGSGTFLIEGATKAMNIAPGINRRFVSENWQSIPQSVWREERQRCFDLIRRDASFTAYGSDIDPESILLSEHNAKKAGVSSRIKFKSGLQKRTSGPVQLSCIRWRFAIRRTVSGCWILSRQKKFIKRWENNFFPACLTIILLRRTTNLKSFSADRLPNGESFITA